MIRPIVKHGNPVLHQKSEEVREITPDIQQLIDDMIETMYAASGIGLAAPQVGFPLRIFVVDLSAGRQSEELTVMINPTFVERGGTQFEEEGCLSIPGFNATVARPLTVSIRGLDRNGVEHTKTGSGLMARAFQHEMDHLDGTVFVDRLSGIRREMILRRIQKLKRHGKW
jgi:peptide deformylase